eukprot:UN17061
MVGLILRRTSLLKFLFLLPLIFPLYNYNYDFVVIQISFDLDDNTAVVHIIPPSRNLFSLLDHNLLSDLYLSVLSFFQLISICIGHLK